MEEKKTYTLMNKERPIIDFDYNNNLNIIEKIYHSYPQNEKYAPLGIIDIKVGINRKDFMIWFKNRIIPESRNGIERYLKSYQNDYNLFLNDIIEKRHGFSLSDQYWIKKKDEQTTWKEGNFFENDFDETTGKKIINKNIRNSSIPSHSTNGNLEKKWIIEKKKRYLLKGSTNMKQEPLNEVIATKLYQRILKKDEYVSYELYKDKSKKQYSKCQDFITKNTELVPAIDILKVAKQDNRETDYEFFLRCCKILKIPQAKDYMNKILTCDFILGNSDRHYNNFGAIRDVNTLKYLKMSPIFDNGNCLGINSPTKNEFTTYPFYENPKKQLNLVDNLSWLDITKLQNFEEEAMKLLIEDKVLSKEYIKTQIKDLQQRIKIVEKYQKNLSQKRKD